MIDSSIGHLFVVTGPSGAGKDSVIEEAKKAGLLFGNVITTSTRPMRDTESEGYPYYFINAKEFEEKIAQNEMIEWAKVYGNYYGSTRSEIERVLSTYDVVIVKVDPQGARTFQSLFPDAVTIFIAPPSFDILKQRLIQRAQDPADVIESRLQSAESELQQMDQWDHIIVNEEGKLESAAAQLQKIISDTQKK